MKNNVKSRLESHLECLTQYAVLMNRYENLKNQYPDSVNNDHITSKVHEGIDKIMSISTKIAEECISQSKMNGKFNEQKALDALLNRSEITQEEYDWFKSENS
jgi:hypothetical protein